MLNPRLGVRRCRREEANTQNEGESFRAQAPLIDVDDELTELLLLACALKEVRRELTLLAEIDERRLRLTHAAPSKAVLSRLPIQRRLLTCPVRRCA